MYTAMIYKPGLAAEPIDRLDYIELIEDAWLWLAEQRELHEERADCAMGSCDKVVETLAAQQMCGKVHAHTPKMIWGGPDIGINYSVDPML